MSHTTATLAVTLGDPRGIGPEVVLAASTRFLAEQPNVSLCLIGDEASLAEAPEGVAQHSVGPFDGSELGAGRVSLDAIREGVRLCSVGEAHGLVTGPVHKPSLHAAGARYPGQTELLQNLTGAPCVGMLMHAERTPLSPHPLRILLATTHMALSQVPVALTEERLTEQTALLHWNLVERWGIEHPRLAICALNPHASDGGLFGQEERTIVAPAIEALRRMGMDVSGPFPADTVFLRAIRGEADAVVVPYHDVGMAVFKTLAFGGGVNVTLGLPFPRTSPDHGTAFDRVGTGTADSSSTLEALRLAARLAL